MKPIDQPTNRRAGASRLVRRSGSAVALTLLGACSTMQSMVPTQVPLTTPKRELMIVGNDEKQSWDAAGRAVFGAPGRDSVMVLDIGSNPLEPKVLATLPLMNTIAGPPTNLAITSNEKLAIVANSLDMVADGPNWKPVPDNKLWVIDLEATPPKLIDTVVIGKQPSGLAINRAGTLALVANRADGSVSVLRIAGKKVELIDTVVIGEQVSHVVFTPDGKRAVVTKFPGHKIAMLDVAGEKVTYAKVDAAVGLWPYNADVTPDGRIALSADNGNAGAADGNVDTVSVIDLEAKVPHVIDKVVVGDGPEGIAISPTGKFAVTLLLRGSNSATDAYYYNRNGSIVGLKIDGKTVTRGNEVIVKGLPEGVVFSDNGRFVYVGNFIDQNISILRVDGDTLVDTGKTFTLPGHPASMRGKTR